MSSLYSHSEFSLQEGGVMTRSISLLRITHCGRGCILCSWPLRIRSLLTPLLVETKPRRLRRAGDSLRPLRRARLSCCLRLPPSGLGKTWRKPLSLSPPSPLSLSYLITATRLSSSSSDGDNDDAASEDVIVMEPRRSLFGTTRALARGLLIRITYVTT